jgi:hypothetical protein
MEGVLHVGNARDAAAAIPNGEYLCSRALGGEDGVGGEGDGGPGGYFEEAVRGECKGRAVLSRSVSIDVLSSRARALRTTAEGWVVVGWPLNSCAFLFHPS